MEVWKPVVGYEGYYEVSNLGRIKSLYRILMRSNGRKHTWPERIIKPQPTRTGYLTAGLRKVNSGKIELIHRLVAAAFIERRDGKPFVNHKDSKKSNNVVENLEWVDKRENQTHFEQTKSKKLTGAFYYKSQNSWAARVKIDKKCVFIGHFRTELEAHIAYNNYLNNNLITNKYSNGN